MPFALVKPVCDYVKIRSLCCRPYPNHPRGCPRFNKKDGCPPRAPLLHEVIRLDGSAVMAVWGEFPLSEHMAIMQARHPKWTDRQLRNPLYWQGRARKHLRWIVQSLLFAQHIPPVIVWCPEACGCNLSATMEQAGITLDWPPQQIAYQIVLAGWEAEK